FRLPVRSRLRQAADRFSSRLAHDKVGFGRTAHLQSVVAAHPQREEDGKVSCTMNDGDYLNRLHVPDISHHIGIEVPEPILSAQKFIVIMANSRSTPEYLKGCVELR